MVECYDNVGNIYSSGCFDLKTVQQNVESIEIKASAKTIYGVSDKDYAFINCASTINKVAFPRGSLLETICPYSFYCCSKISKINLSNCTKLTEIGDHAFYNCISLSSITFPPSLVSIRSYSFWSSRISSLFIPKSVKIIETQSFRSNPLTNVEFEDGIDLKALPWYVFAITTLTTFTFPDSLESFDAVCFESSNSMKEIKTVANKKFVVTNGALFTINHEDLVYMPPCYCSDTYAIPSGTKRICIEAFLHSRAKKIIIPDSVHTISSHAFWCSAIETMVVPDSVKSIGYIAFGGCISLKNITLSSALTNLAESLFESCSGLQSISIPESVKSIGSSCFKGCTSLKDVVLPTNISTLGGGAFASCPNLHLTFAPESSLRIDDQYIIYMSDDTIISQFIGSNENADISINSNVTYIKDSSFYCKNNIISVTFPDDCSLKVIERRAFYQCTNLKSIEFPPNLEQIGEYAFYWCTSLKSVKFSSKIKMIQKYAFHSCSALEELIFEDLENSIKLSIAEFCFYDCANIKSIKLCEGLTTIGKAFLGNNKKLEALSFPSTIVNICENSFENTNIETVSFAENSVITEIGDKAFYHATKLSSFTIPPCVVKIGIEAFAGTQIESLVLPQAVNTLRTRCFKDCISLSNVQTDFQTSHLRKIEEGVFEGCKNLEVINCTNDFFKTINGVLYDSEETSIIIFPPASKTMFLNVPSKVRVIGPSAFYGCKNLFSVLMPDDSSLTTIGASAFSECINLRSINIPLSVKSIGANAFYRCKSLACGQAILNSSYSFKQSLLDNAKLPKRCIIDCSAFHTKKSCRRKISSDFLTYIFLITYNS